MLVRRKNHTSIPQSVQIPLRSQNTYTEATDVFLEGGMVSTSDGKFDTTIGESDVKEMLANPDDNLNDISNLMTYYFISNGDIYTLYTLYKCLPTLKYKVGAFDSTIKRYELSISEITKALHKVRYKELTRDIIGQVCAMGGAVTMWCGDKKNLYLYVFENTDYVFPKYRVNGEWQCVVDMKWFDDMKEEERMVMFMNLSPFVTETQYNAYKSDTQSMEKRYVLLPQDRTTYIRGDALKRNQRIGTPVGTQSIFSILHKELLTNLEKSVSNRVMKNIGVLTIGSDEEGKSYVDINPSVRKQIIRGVGSALKQNASTTSDKIPVVSLPEFADLKFNKVDSLDALKGEKFDNVNRDISKDTGIGSAFTSGDTGNYSTAQVNEKYLYRRIGMLLEQIEVIFEKMFKLKLPKNVADNFYFEFDTSVPLSKKDELTTLTQLMSFGWSPKAVIDMLQGVGFDNYLEESLYFQNMGIYDIIKPPQTAYTMTNNGEEEKEKDDTNENTVASDAFGSNENPSPEGE